jgi:hypothetical protein
LERDISLPQLREWIAYYRLEPFGDDWRRTGRLAAVTAASAGAKIGHDMEDKFLPTYRPGGPPQTDAEMERELAKISAYLNHE